jgi:hypothetical protein
MESLPSLGLDELDPRPSKKPKKKVWSSPRPDKLKGNECGVCQSLRIHAQRADESHRGVVGAGGADGQRCCIERALDTRRESRDAEAGGSSTNVTRPDLAQCAGDAPHAVDHLYVPILLKPTPAAILERLPCLLAAGQSDDGKSAADDAGMDGDGLEE